MHKHEYIISEQVLPDLDDVINRLTSVSELTRGMSVALTSLETARLWLQNELVEADAK